MFKKLFKRKYRIVRDRYAGFEVQISRFGLRWAQPTVNSSSSLTEAVERAKLIEKQLSGEVVCYLDANFEAIPVD